MAVRPIRKLGAHLRAFPQKVARYNAIRREETLFWQRYEETASQGFSRGSSHYCLDDADSQAGVASGHYFHQDLLVAQRVHHAAPTAHLDVGSSVSGLVAHIASFRTVHYLDIRPIHSDADNVTFHQGDLLKAPKFMYESFDSVSCLHTLEHIGLGRYGDEVDPAGWVKGIRALSALLVPGGTLYVSVPCSTEPRVEFNAHRVFDPQTFSTALARDFDVIGFDVVLDNGRLLRSVDDDSWGVYPLTNVSYGLGIWTAKKRRRTNS